MLEIRIGGQVVGKDGREMSDVLERLEDANGWSRCEVDANLADTQVRVTRGTLLEWTDGKQTVDGWALGERIGEKVVVRLMGVRDATGGVHGTGRNVTREEQELIGRCQERAWNAVPTLRNCRKVWSNEVDEEAAQRMTTGHASVWTNGPKLESGAVSLRLPDQWLQNELERVLENSVLNEVHKSLKRRKTPRPAARAAVVDTVHAEGEAVILHRSGDELMQDQDLLWHLPGWMQPHVRLEFTHSGPHCVFAPREVTTVLDPCTNTEWFDSGYPNAVWPGLCVVSTPGCRLATGYVTRSGETPRGLRYVHVHVLRYGALLREELQSATAEETAAVQPKKQPATYRSGLGITPEEMERGSRQEGETIGERMARSA